jgi:hypothetical protein
MSRDFNLKKRNFGGHTGKTVIHLLDPSSATESSLKVAVVPRIYSNHKRAVSALELTILYSLFFSW